MSNASFKQIQTRFVEQLKDPQKLAEETWLKDIEPRRLAVYQRLLRNNIFRFIDSSFPVLRKLASEKQWFETKERFFRNFSSDSPYFTGIAESFVDYLQLTDELFVFAAELAHYEWAELSVEQKIWPENYSVLTDELRQEQVIGLNPTAILASYQYPVDEISEKFQPLQPLPELRFLVVFRDSSGRVRFIRINAMTYLLLTELQKDMKLKAVIERLPQLLPQWSVAQLAQGAMHTLNRLSKQQLILTVKN